MSAQDLEPVAWITPESIRHLAKMNGPANVVVWNCASGNARVPLYAAPQPQQPAPVVDDARMARALEAARCGLAPEHVSAIEEAIAAYDPNCGARTVRLDDAMREDAERYRWLRENAGAWEVSKDAAEWTKCETGEKFRPRVYFTAFSTGYGGMLLDDAIDAARAQGVQS